jgi:transketolase
MTDLKELAKSYRRELFEKFIRVGQGHPGSTFSMVEIATTLYHAGFVRLGRDTVIISKGHATVGLYPILASLGVIPKVDWESWGEGDSCLRVFGNTSIPGIDITSGSLGHGIGIGAGIALAAKRDGEDKRIFVVISEGELYEGSTWEALLFIAHHNLSNLTVLIDINNYIILGSTDECLALNPIEEKLKGFEIELLEIDGHDTASIVVALEKKTKLSKVILARTIKGRGLSIMENQANWHYMNPLTPSQVQQCRKELL